MLRSLFAVSFVIIASGCGRTPDAAAASPSGAAPSGRPSAAANAAVSSAVTTPLAQTNNSMINALKPSIIGHATLDGSVISDIRQADACHTTFTTSRGPTTIAWRQVGNVTTHLVGSHQETSLMTDKVAHSLSVPTGGYADADADGIRGALGQLAGECQAR